jgi:molybdate transport system ATP-binding protein
VSGPARKPDTPLLDVRLVRRVHAELTIDIGLALGPECGVVFGPSGVGKTTLLRLIAGLERPDAGHVRLGGLVLFDSEARVRVPLRSRRVGMVFQDDLLFPHLPVESNLHFGLRGWPRAEAAARVAEVAALCGVHGLLKRGIESLSGGERQRVGLARALAPRPRLLLCDEPVSALDLESRHALVENLRLVQRAEAIPVLYVTHSPSEAVALGSTLFLMERGRVVAQGPPLDVLASARGAWLSAPEGLRNTFRARVEFHLEGGGATRLRLDGGPSLIVHRVPLPPGQQVVVDVLAEEILLARGPVEGLSARNVIAGTVERVLGHGADAEVLVRTGDLLWVVSVVEPAVAALGLEPGAEVWLVIKARSCRVTGAD